VVAGLRAANPNLKHLGVTATPQRGDGLALANGFTHTAFTVTIADLVRRAIWSSRAGTPSQPRLTWPA
jgi:hypothetical protein